MHAHKLMKRGISNVFGCFRSLGEAFPCMSAFVAGKAAAYKMFETIKRRPNIDSYNSKGKNFG